MSFPPVTLVDYSKTGAPGEALEVDRLARIEIKILRSVLLGEIMHVSREIFELREKADIAITSKDDAENNPAKYQSQYRQELFEVLHAVDGEPYLEIGNASLLIGFEQLRTPLLSTLKHAIERVVHDNHIVLNLEGMPCAPHLFRTVLTRLQEFVNKAIELSGPA
jgi:hypothetical protein